MTDAADFQFELPPDLIAQEPTARRGDSRLLEVRPGHGVRGERPFRDLPDLLDEGDLLVVNESRVLPARLFTTRRDTGGRVEVLLVEPIGDAGHWSAMARPARRLRPGIHLRIDETDDELEVMERRDDGLIEVRGSREPAELATQHGVMPLPPYIDRMDADLRDPSDRERYQTVFAATEARSVAAPTAGLHFSTETLDRLSARGVAVAPVRLHVGPGTFQPPTDGQIAARRLHREQFELPAETAAAVRRTRRAGSRVVAVGTTSLRVLETAARLALPASGGNDQRDFTSGVFHGRARRVDGIWALAGSTRLFVAPPDRIACVDGLLTNFHLPGSSLLMLVAALAGEDTWRGVYEHAVSERMRFYSYGDCMLILHDTETNS